MLVSLLVPPTGGKVVNFSKILCRLFKKVSKIFEDQIFNFSTRGSSSTSNVVNTTRQQQNFLHNPGTISLTLTSSSVAQLQLLLLVCQFVDVLLTEYRVQVSLVSSIRDADEDREEEEGEHRLPDLHLVFGVDHEDDDQPDICEYRGDSCDAEDKKVTNPGTRQISATS